MALGRNTEAAREGVDLGHEGAGHGYRWIHYQSVTEDVEREHLRHCVDIVSKLLGRHPEGWYTGRDSPNTLRLVAEEGGFLYDSDYYGDDLPFWTNVALGNGQTRPQLMGPYTPETNDMRFASAPVFNSSQQFYCSLKDPFDVLYAEGQSHTTR